MKRHALPALALACLVSLAGSARGDDFADFRIPTHRVLLWTGDFDGWWRGSTSDVPASRVRQGLLFGATGSGFQCLSDGESGATILFLAASFRGDRTSQRESGYDQSPLLASSSDQQALGRSTDELGEAVLSLGRYVGRTPIVLGVDAVAFGDLFQSWSSSRTASSQTDPVSTVDQWSQSDDRSRRSNLVASLRPRVGLGRVRDATGVYTARVIEERLRGDGVLTRALSHEARQKLAELLTLSGAYDELHVRPAKGLWAEIERVVREDGALGPGGLDASSTQHAGESLLEALSRGRRADGLPGTIVLRMRGASASAFVDGIHRRGADFMESGSESQTTVNGVPQPIFSSRSSQSSVASSDAVDAGLQAEWHRPVGLRVQLDASAEASVPVRPQDDGFAVAMNGEASWLVADRWLVQGAVNQRRDLLQDAADGSTRADAWSLNLAGQVSYEVEDHVTIQLRVQDTQAGNRQPGAGVSFSRRYGREQYVSLGFSYRFAGRFSAPGFDGLSRSARRIPPLEVR